MKTEKFLNALHEVCLCCCWQSPDDKTQIICLKCSGMFNLTSEIFQYIDYRFDLVVILRVSREIILLTLCLPADSKPFPVMVS